MSEFTNGKGALERTSTPRHASTFRKDGILSYRPPSKSHYVAPGVARPELIDNICGCCELRDIKSLRLTCRYLKDIADSHLLDNVQILLAEASIRTAEQIANHPGLSKGPQTLYLGADCLKFLSFFDWSVNRLLKTRTKNVPAALMRELLNHKHDEEHYAHYNGETKIWPIVSQIDAANGVFGEEMQARYRDYISLATDASLLKAPGNLRKRLGRVLQNCHSLNAVILGIGDGIENAHPLPFKICNRAYDKGLLTPDRFDEDPCTSGVAAMVELVLAANDTSFSPRTLSRGWVSHRLLAQDELAGKFGVFLRKVEVLHWVFSIPESYNVAMLEGDILRPNFEQGAFLRFISKAENLSHLELEMPEQVDKWSRVNLNDLFNGLTFPRLATFKIQTIRAEPQYFSKLLLRHAPTLEFLRFAEIKLTEGDWSDFFESIAGKLQKLEHMELRGSLDCPGDPWYWFGELKDPSDCKYGSQLAKYVVMGGQLPDMPAPVSPGADGESDGDEYPEDESFAGMLMPGNFHLDV